MPKSTYMSNGATKTVAFPVVACSYQLYIVCFCVQRVSQRFVFSTMLLSLGKNVLQGALFQRCMLSQLANGKEWGRQPPYVMESNERERSAWAMDEWHLECICLKNAGS